MKSGGHLTGPGRGAASASLLYARNLFAFLETMVDKATKTLAIKRDDELVKATMLTDGGKVVHANFAAAAALAEAAPAAAPAKPAAKPASAAKASINAAKPAKQDKVPSARARAKAAPPLKSGPAAKGGKSAKTKSGGDA